MLRSRTDTELLGVGLAMIAVIALGVVQPELIDAIDAAELARAPISAQFRLAESFRAMHLCFDAIHQIGTLHCYREGASKSPTKPRYSVDQMRSPTWTYCRVWIDSFEQLNYSILV